MKLAAGTGFTTVTPFQGVLPLLPDLGSYDKATLKKYLDADAASFKPELVDTYWTGKSLGKLATLAAISRMPRVTKPPTSSLRRGSKRLLEDYFTAKPGKTKGLFLLQQAVGDAHWLPRVLR